MKCYFRLIRVQSTPLTLGILAAGYGLYHGTVAEIEIIPLLMVGALGHWGFYAMNEYEDVRYDRKAGKDDKPLVSGDVSKKQAQIIVASLVGSSLLLAGALFPVPAFSAYILSAWLGAVYNKRSKMDTISGVYLGIWGVLILYTGFYYAAG